MERIFLSLLILSLFAGCRGRSQTEDREVVDLYSYKDNQIDYFSLVDTTSYRVVKLELTENSLIGEISKVEVIDDRIIILDRRDNKSVFMFDMEGNFIRQIGRKGRGPGEYVSAVNFVLDYDNGHIIVSDYGTPKQMFYDLDGRFIKEYRLSYLPMAYIEGRFFYAWNPMSTPEHYEVVELDTASKVVGGYYPRKRYVEKIDGYYTSRSYFFQDGKNYYFIPLFTDKLYLLTRDGIELKHTFGFGERVFDYDRSRHTLTRDENTFRDITNFAVTDDLNYFFSVSYGLQTSFWVYGNLESNKVVASGILSTSQNNSSVTPKTIMTMGIIGSYKDEFISTFNAWYFKNLFPDATEEDNPYLVFFKVKNLD